MTKGVDTLAYMSPEMPNKTLYFVHRKRTKVIIEGQNKWENSSFISDF